MECNQYPPAFYEPFIEKSLTKIIERKESDTNKLDEENQTETTNRMIFVEYREKITDDYERSLRKCNAPCTVVMTLKKLRTILPSFVETACRQISKKWGSISNYMFTMRFVLCRSDRPTSSNPL